LPSLPVSVMVKLPAGAFLFALIVNVGEPFEGAGLALKTALVPRGRPVTDRLTGLLVVVPLGASARVKGVAALSEPLVTDIDDGGVIVKSVTGTVSIKLTECVIPPPMPITLGV